MVSWKDYVSPSHLGLEECLSDLEQWSQDFAVAFGITGSALNKSNESLNDLDLIAIVRDPNIQCFPIHFSRVGWKDYLELHKLGEAEVFVTHYEGYERLRLELYPLSIAERILALEEFTIRRIGKGPLRTKPTIFYGVNGSSRFRTTQPISRCGASFAEIESCIWEEGILFVGVHLERLLLAKFFVDELQVDKIQKRAWRDLGKLFGSLSTEDMPFNGEVECIFLGSQKLTPSTRMRIRRLLLQQDEFADSYDF